MKSGFVSIVGKTNVGKSSIINALFDKEKTQEGEISKKNNSK